MPVDPFVFVLLSACLFRIVRLIVFDSLFGAHPDSGSGFSKRLDGWAWTRDGADRSWVRGKAGTLVTCPHCAGMWLSLLLVCVWLRWWPWWLGVEGWATVGAVAGVQSLLSALDRKMGD